MRRLLGIMNKTLISKIDVRAGLMPGIHKGAKFGRIAATIGFAAVALSAWGQEPPSPAEQQRILQTVIERGDRYAAKLPNFTCTRITRRHVRATDSADWLLQVKVAEELTFAGGHDDYHIVAVNDVPKNEVEGMQSIDSGTFFVPGMTAALNMDPPTDVRWVSWFHFQGKLVHVFEYRVPQGHSRFSDKDCKGLLLECRSVKSAYHGFFYVDAQSLDLARITVIFDGVPASLDFRSANFSVDYGQVSLGDREYLLPAAENTQGDLLGIPYWNESTYSSCRDFKPEAAPKAAPAAATSGADLRSAANYFELRDQVVRSKASPIAVAFVAAAFNDLETAEKKLQDVLRSDPHSEPALIAQLVLADVYRRTGRARQALEQVKQVQAMLPTGTPTSNGETPHPLEVLAQYPEQSVERRGFSRLPLQRVADAPAIGVSVNGKTGQFGFDTGASVSFIYESQARSLGLKIHDDRFSLTDLAGGGISCRLGIANELVAGKFRLRDVPFCVLADLPAAPPDAQLGSLGLPVLLAFETIRWTRDGRFEIGFPPARRRLRESNLCLMNDRLTVDAVLDSHRLPLDLDTGNTAATFLGRDFTDDFTELARTAGPKKKRPLGGLCNCIGLDSAELPNLEIRIGGLRAALHSVPVFLEPVPNISGGSYGNAGMDLLNQARTVTLDFRAMKLTLDR
jgi:hypothetical protein